MVGSNRDDHELLPKIGDDAGACGGGGGSGESPMTC